MIAGISLLALRCSWGSGFLLEASYVSFDAAALQISCLYPGWEEDKRENVKGTYPSETWLWMKKKQSFPGELCLISLAHGQAEQQGRQKKYCVFYIFEGFFLKNRFPRNSQWCRKSHAGSLLRCDRRRETWEERRGRTGEREKRTSNVVAKEISPDDLLGIPQRSLKWPLKFVTNWGKGALF